MRLLLCVVVLMMGCDIDEPSGYAVTHLFNDNGCDVYRFRDRGYNHYYSVCRGADKSETSTQIRSGKSSYPETIQTNAVP